MTMTISASCMINENPVQDPIIESGARTIINIDRDSPGWVTLYDKSKDGQKTWWFTLSQDLIDALKQV